MLICFVDFEISKQKRTVRSNFSEKNYCPSQLEALYEVNALYPVKCTIVHIFLNKEMSNAGEVLKNVYLSIPYGDKRYILKDFAHVYLSIHMSWRHLEQVS